VWPWLRLRTVKEKIAQHAAEKFKVEVDILSKGDAKVARGEEHKVIGLIPISLFLLPSASMPTLTKTSAIRC
jgi:hypothetical protein